jgi:DNA-binding transcriptional LysR family regulator
LQYVRKIEAISNEAIVALAPFGGQESVELSIGASHTVAIYLLPKLLPQLMHEWPHLKIHIYGGSTHDVLQALTSHQVGIALIEAPSYRPDLKLEAFAEDELSLIVHPNHHWADKPLIRAAELVKEPLLLREDGSGMRHFVEGYLEQNGILRQQLRTNIDMNSTEGIISAVEAGLGVGFAPSLAIEKELRLGTVKAIQLDKGPIRRKLNIALLNGPDPRGPAGLLLELLRDHGKAQRQGIAQNEATDEPERVLMMSSAKSTEHAGATS